MVSSFFTLISSALPYFADGTSNQSGSSSLYSAWVISLLTEFSPRKKVFSRFKKNLKLPRRFKHPSCRGKFLALPESRSPRAICPRCLHSKSNLKHGSDERGRNAVAGDVGNETAELTAFERKEIVEVAGDGTHGEIASSDLQASNAGHFA